MSGAPLWKVKEQMARERSMMPINLPLAPEDNEPPKIPNVLVDAATAGGHSDKKRPPCVRHVLIKDLHKVARSTKTQLPTEGVFANKAPLGLYALFDGQSCAGEAGPKAAEFCARNFHSKLLECLSGLRQYTANEAFIKAALIKSFEDLDRDLLTTQPEVMDGCGAAVVLLIGGFIFAVQLGRCSAVLCETVQGEARASLLCDTGVGGSLPRLGNTGGAKAAPVTRSLGDRAWKGAAGGGVGAPLVMCRPEVQSIELTAEGSQRYVLLCASTVAAALTAQEMVDAASPFQVQPRAACGQIIQRVLEAQAQGGADAATAQAQCTAVQICFLPPREKEEGKKQDAASEAAPPPQKKPKVDKKIAPGGVTKSVRLRHILVKFTEGDPKPAVGKKAAVVRNRQDAETILRTTMNELRKDLKSQKQEPKDATALILASSKKFQELCKSTSECDTAHKGGGLCGDLGWVSPEQRTSMGGTFKEVTDVLQPGMWSDIAVSSQGLHLVQRTA